LIVIYIDEKIDTKYYYKVWWLDRLGILFIYG
jgi:hypothetical protein